MKSKVLATIPLAWSWNFLNVAMAWAHEGHDHSPPPSPAAASSGASSGGGSFLAQFAGSSVAGIGTIVAIVLLVGVVGALLTVVFRSRR